MQTPASAAKSKSVPTCQVNHSVDISQLDIECFRLQTLSLDKAQQMAEFFRLLGDPNRLRILSLLAKRDLCVCDLANILEMSESAVSHQLRGLRSLRLVSYTKRGRKVYYRLLDHHVLELYKSVSEHLEEVDWYPSWKVVFWSCGDTLSNLSWENFVKSYLSIAEELKAIASMQLVTAKRNTNMKSKK